MSETALRRYDSAEVLKSEEAIAVHLDKALDDAALTPADMGRYAGVVARARMLNRFARDAGLDSDALTEALSGEAPPSVETVLMIAAALGVRLTHPADPEPPEQAASRWPGRRSPCRPTERSGGFRHHRKGYGASAACPASSA